MSERIVNLLLLCMQAQEKGHNILFDNSATSTTVWHYTSLEEEQKVIWYRILIHDLRDINLNFDEVEDYLKGLIENDRR